MLSCWKRNIIIPVALGLTHMIALHLDRVPEPNLHQSDIRLMSYWCRIDSGSVYGTGSCVFCTFSLQLGFSWIHSSPIPAYMANLSHIQTWLFVISHPVICCKQVHIQRNDSILTSFWLHNEVFVLLCILAAVRQILLSVKQNGLALHCGWDIFILLFWSCYH